MNRERFDFLASELETYAQANPTKYRLRVGLLAALGYGYLFFIALLLLAVVVGTVITVRLNFLVIKLLWLPLLLVGAVGRALWVRFPAPEGRELKTEEAPRLFEMTDEVSRALGAPRPHQVLITDEFNAAIVQRPRLGIFGWQENYLILGLPLMQALSPAQFRSVIAHEFGHFAGNHGRFGGWIYRVRLTWYQLLARLHEEGRRGSFIFERFLNWYAPFFDAYTFVLARQQEYEADKCAVEVAGRESAAEALINVNVKHKFLDECYWRDVFKQADHTATPPALAFAEMFPALQHHATINDSATVWLRRSLLEQTSNTDTHPSLAARLAAMNFKLNAEDDLNHQLPHLFAPLAETAANYFLGETNETLIAEMNARWREQTAETWRERHAYMRETRAKLVALAEKRQTSALDAEELWTYAACLAEVEGADAAETVARELLEREPDHAAANFLYGQILVRRNDAEGARHIERAMNNDISLTLPACETLYGFYKENNQDEAAQKVKRRAEDFYETIDKAQSERQTISSNDRFEPHDLTAAQVEDVAKQLARYDEVKAAFLVCKSVSYLQQSPLYVLGIVPAVKWYRFRSADAGSRLVTQLINELNLPGGTFVITLEGEYKRLRGTFKRIEGAQIFVR